MNKKIAYNLRHCDLVQLQGFFVLFTSFIGLGLDSSNPETEDDGLPIFGKVGVVKFASFLSSFLKGIISSTVSSFIVGF